MTEPPDTLTPKEVKAIFDRAGIESSLKIVMAGIGDRIYKREGDVFILLDNKPPKVRAIDGP